MIHEKTLEVTRLIEREEYIKKYMISSAEASGKHFNINDDDENRNKKHKVERDSSFNPNIEHFNQLLSFHETKCNENDVLKYNLKKDINQLTNIDLKKAKRQLTNLKYQDTYSNKTKKVPNMTKDVTVNFQTDSKTNVTFMLT